jgi:hypothetical protein
MKYTKLVMIYAFLFCIAFIGCRKVFDIDISQGNIQLLSPENNLNTPIQSLTFSWTLIPEAHSYQLQIGKPSFDSLVQLIEDTLIKDEYITISLSPGTYEWRIRGINNSYQTPFSTRKLTIDTSSNLKFYIPKLNEPVNTCISAQNRAFHWEAISPAQLYQIKIIKGRDFENIENMLMDKTVDTNYFELSNDFELGIYSWRVFAFNSKSKTDWSTTEFEVTSINPTEPILNLPIDNTTIPVGNVEFLWSQKYNGDHCQESDELEVAHDANFTQILFKVLANQSMYTDSLQTGTFYWRVKRKSPLGEIRASNTRHFNVF